jgi:hypothetical protein
VVRTGLDEYGAPLRHRHGLALDLEHAASFENDVHLVVLVGLLAVGLGRDQNVDAELEARRLVDDLVAAGRGYETILGLRNAEGVHGGDPTRRR